MDSGRAPLARPGMTKTRIINGNSQEGGMRELVGKALKALLCLAVMGTMAATHAAAPEPQAITPQLIEAAKKEGKVVFYTAIDLQVAERIAKAFEAAYGVRVQ